MALISLALFSVFALFAPLVYASFSISPAGSTIKQCSQVDLIFTEVPPVHMWVAPNREISPGDPVLEDLGVINDSFVLWTVNLPVGQVVSFTYVRIAQQTLLFSSPQSYTVVAGDTAACLPGESTTTTTISTTSQPPTTTKPPPTTSTPSVSSASTHSNTVSPPLTSNTNTASTTSSASASVLKSAITTSISSPVTSTAQRTDNSTQSSSSTITSSGGTLPTASSTTEADEKSPTRSSTGVIVGAVVGGVAVLIGLLASILFCIRRNRRRTGAARHFPVPSDPELDPSTLHSPSPPGISLHTSQMNQHNLQPGSVTDSSPGTGAPSQYSSPSQWTGQTSLQNSYGGSNVSTAARAREIDAGIILEAGADINGSVSLPPAYEDVRRPSRPPGHHPMPSTDTSSAGIDATARDGSGSGGSGYSQPMPLLDEKPLRQHGVDVA